MKTSAAAKLSIAKNIQEMAALPYETKVLHLVFPPGHLPINVKQVESLAEKLGIHVIIDHL
ncbi:hypothetical protein [Chitinophaga rhizosphaerae]|uniref:hypothetical protein n=1 Tax=Chitinophaga rhizosphaerae TaxID=1864947 RepID=UPI000F80ACF2|nr:hypothetical protein [Chitinophaga rhizosphaerae]